MSQVNMKRMSKTYRNGKDKKKVKRNKKNTSERKGKSSIIYMQLYIKVTDSVYNILFK